MTKYRAKPTEVDGIRFSSKREASRYMDLKLLAKSGCIRDLELQPKYPIHVRQTLICTYIGDFRYFDVMKDKWICEDSKGMKTPVYKLKKKLFEAIYQDTILET